jgi:hypothetical protein
MLLLAWSDHAAEVADVDQADQPVLTILPPRSLPSIYWTSSRQLLRSAHGQNPSIYTPSTEGRKSDSVSKRRGIQSRYRFAKPRTAAPSSWLDLARV